MMPLNKLLSMTLYGKVECTNILYNIYTYIPVYCGSLIICSLFSVKSPTNNNYRKKMKYRRNRKKVQNKKK